jgi:cellulose biosynthesis protein BcsQ
VLVFAASDKGGTGRSVTSANLAYQRALAGDHVAYVDFDFGSPTAAAVFDVPGAMRGTEDRGLHSYLEGEVAEPARIDVWRQTEHPLLRARPNQSGRLVRCRATRAAASSPPARTRWSAASTCCCGCTASST